MAAVMLLVKVVAEDSSYVETTLCLFFDALTCNNPDKKYQKRLRHGTRIILESGMHAQAIFAEIADTITKEHDKALQEWSKVANDKIRQLPLSPREWISAAEDARSSDVVHEHADTDNASWVRATENARTPRTLASWNANSLFRRMRMGQLAEFLRENPLDVLHISELKGDPLNAHCSAKDLRLALFALGYVHVVWNWCVDTPSIHGSAVFSRCPMEQVTFGTGTDGLLDPEGRTITTHFKEMTVI